MSTDASDVRKLRELTQLLEEKVIERTQQLMRAKRTWEATFDAFTDPVAIVDRKMNIIRTNLAHASQSGTDVRSVSGRCCHEVLFEREQPCPGCPVQQTLHSGTMNEGEIKDARKGRIYRMWSVPMNSEESAQSSPDSPTDWAVCHYKDVTDEKALQRQIMQSEKMAAVGTLAGGVAHEINNPLGAILVFTQLAMSDVDKDAPIHEFLQEIEASANRCKRIVADLLDFSRQSKGERKPVDLAEVCERVVFLCRTQYDRGNVELRTDLSDDVPRINADRHQLQQVLINLISNAYGALEGAGHITVRTSATPGESVSMLVTDDGPGIDDVTLAKLFEPFFTTKPEGEGTGLGLAVSYGIVEDHNGTIEVESELGVGSTFEVRFPWPTEEMGNDDNG